MHGLQIYMSGRLESGVYADTSVHAESMKMRVYVDDVEIIGLLLNLVHRE